MAATTHLQLPYPAPSDPPDGSGGIYNLAKALDDAAGSAFTFAYAGTVHDWGTPSNGWTQKLRASAGLGSIVIPADPGANGLSASTTNNGIGSLPVGMRPAVNMSVECAIYHGTWTGDRAQVQINQDGSLIVNYCSVALASGHFVLIAATYPLALP